MAFPGEINLAPVVQDRLVHLHRDDFPQKQIVRAKVKRLDHLAFDVERAFFDHGRVDDLRWDSRQADRFELVL